MVGLENGETAARESSSMDPLWEEYVFHTVFFLPYCSFFPFYLPRYVFPAEPDNSGFIDLTGDDVSFYLNPYSGEMSLEFPKVDRSCRGGILAYVSYCLIQRLTLK